VINYIIIYLFLCIQYTPTHTHTPNHSNYNEGELNKQELNSLEINQSIGAK
jgi:hypothetical protein